jgi:hypothetical protein
MRLRHLVGRPVVHAAWGWIVGWVRDVWIDPHAGCVAAFEVCMADRMQVRCVEPFLVQRSRRHGLAVESDPDQWQAVQRQPSWIPVRGLADLLVVQDDGQRACRLADAECDPDSWAITRYRIWRRWWELFGARGLAPDRVVAGGPELLVVAGDRSALQHAAGSQPNQVSGTGAGAPASSTEAGPPTQARGTGEQVRPEARTSRQGSARARTPPTRKKRAKGTTRRKHDRRHRH